MPPVKTKRSSPFRSRKDEQRPRALVAAASTIDIGNRLEAQRMRVLRQGWQLDSWSYRDSVPEIHYSTEYKASSSARMRVFVAAYPMTGETDTPIALSSFTGPDAPPASIVAACEAALTDLGNGKLEMAGLLHDLSTNIDLTGECYLMSQENTETGEWANSIRSIDEVIVYDDKYKLREMPMDPQGILGWKDLDPETTYLSRIWIPHPRFRLLSDSPMRALMDTCEALLILRRMIRAAGRSRLAGAGMLLLPNETEVIVDINDNMDPDAQTLAGALMRAMTTPIADEGVASSVVPLLMRMPGEFIDKVTWLVSPSTFDEWSIKVRDELVGIIATGVDLPKMVLAGMEDANHWTALQVSTDTFRSHLEPHIQRLMDCLTAAYLRPYVNTSGVDQADLDKWLRRLVFWYDPTDLVTPPDKSAMAVELYKAGVIGGAAVRKDTGYSEDDAPTPLEDELNMIRNTRTWPANVLEALLAKHDPQLAVPPMAGPPAIPGIKPGEGVVVETATPSAVPTTPSSRPPAPTTSAAPTATGSKLTDTTVPTGLTAASTPKREVNRKLSKRLASIDRDARARLHTAANDAMRGLLAKAGAKVRSKVARKDDLRAQIKSTRNEDVTRKLGRQAVADTGLTDKELVGSDWDSFREQYHQTVADAGVATVGAISSAMGWASDDKRLEALRRGLARGLDEGWSMLDESMHQLAHHLLYNPDPNIDAELIAASRLDTLVPTGLIRASLAVAGGYSVQDFGLLPSISGAMVPALPLGNAVGQVATGTTVGDLLASAGATQEGYEWQHGVAGNPFEPHEALDGLTFTEFDDDRLANPDSFPAVDFYCPGDHSGCTCDVMPLWATDQDNVDAVTSDVGSDASAPEDSSEA